MNRDDFAEHFRMLEVDPGSSFQEVRRAYHHLRELFSKNSIVLDPVKDELLKRFRDWKSTQAE